MYILEIKECVLEEGLIYINVTVPSILFWVVIFFIQYYAFKVHPFCNLYSSRTASTRCFAFQRRQCSL